MTRDISYASSVASGAGRAVVHVVENTTGRMRLIRRAKGYEEEVAAGRDFWEVMVERYGLSLDVVGGSLENIPKDGPLIVVANHPYGILDGLMLGHILSLVRGDFRILANRVFRKAKELDKVILPISFDETKEAVSLNISTRKEALRYLSSGGTIGIFPGGTVATSAKPFSRAMDPSWRTFTAKMISRSGRGSRSNLFRRNKFAAFSGGQPPAFHAPHGSFDQGVQKPRGWPGPDCDRRTDTR